MIVIHINVLIAIASIKYMEKIEKLFAQEHEKQLFLENIFKK